MYRFLNIALLAFLTGFFAPFAYAQDSDEAYDDTNFFPPEVLAQRMDYFYDGSFEDGLKEAKSTNGLYMVQFETSWCRVCKSMQHEVFASEDMMYYMNNERIVALFEDGEKRDDLASRYEIKSYPTTILFNAAGNEVDRIVGYLATSAFIDKLKGHKPNVPRTDYTDFR